MYGQAYFLNNEVTCYEKSKGLFDELYLTYTGVTSDIRFNINVSLYKYIA